jgi:hypothetical protein
MGRAVGARLFVCWILLSSAGPAFAQLPAGTVDREIAVTFDDLPAVSVSKGDPAALAAFTARLLTNFTAHAVPVVGFVNEGQALGPGRGTRGTGRTDRRSCGSGSMLRVRTWQSHLLAPQLEQPPDRGVSRPTWSEASP